MHILILDQVFPGSVYKPVVWSNFTHHKLFIITSVGALSPQDKEKCVYREIPDPSKNAQMELIALEFHQTYKMDKVYTKQEDLILRAAHIRKLLGVDGLQPEQAIYYRDKVKMKEACLANGLKVPNFMRISSACDILEFIQKNGFPCIIKPTFGCASGGITILETQEQLQDYCEHQFLKRIDDDNMEYLGDRMIETVLPYSMYHVNGYYANNEFQRFWPFQYLNTNLGFTKGRPYGNISIPPTDALYQRLYDYTHKLLSILPTPPDLIFHLELFYNGDFHLCEIAARRPGGSIALLIEHLEQEPFHALEFQCNNGLPISQPKNISQVVGDVMIPRQIGILKTVPEKCPLALDYIPLAKQGSNYNGFNVNVLNTAVRLVAHGDSVVTVTEQLEQGIEWVQKEFKYELPDLPQ